MVSEKIMVKKMDVLNKKFFGDIKKSGFGNVLLITSLLGVFVIAGISVTFGVIILTGYSPITGYTSHIPSGLTSSGVENMPSQGVSDEYLAERFASMKATQAMYESSGVLQDSSNSYYGVDSVSQAGCTDSDKGNFYIKGTTQSGELNVDDTCNGTKWLIEWYCDGDNAKVINYLCPAGCDRGACK